MTLLPREGRPSTAIEQRASARRAVDAAQASLLIAAVVGIAIAGALLARDRRLEGLTLGVGALTAAIVVNAVLSYIRWRLHTSQEIDPAEEANAARCPSNSSTHASSVDATP